MPLNKLFLDQDGLAVGNGQLVTSGNTVYIGNTLTVVGELYTAGLARTVTLSQEYSSNNTTLNANGYITAFTEGVVRTSNIVYNSNGNPTRWIETDFGSLPGTNVSYSYAVTYDTAGLITDVTRTKL